MSDSSDPSLREALEDLLETRIFKNVAKRNDPEFARRLAMWLIRYILIVSSMRESLNINLEDILFNLHGDRFKKIIEVTERTFNTIREEVDRYKKYIW